MSHDPLLTDAPDGLGEFFVVIDVVHIVLAMKPIEGNFAQNALEHGVAGLNVDGCRTEVHDAAYARNCSGDRGHGENRSRDMDFNMGCGRANQAGRWPANVIHDGSEEVTEQFPDTGSNWRPSKAHGKTSIWGSGKSGETTCPDDSGSAARFFQTCPKDEDECKPK